MANKDTVKPWFETGDYPTQAQFYQMFDFLRWKDEALAINDVTGLQALLNTIITLAQVLAKYMVVVELDADGQYDMAEGEIITGLIADATLDFLNTVGSTPGGTDIIVALTPETVGVPQPVSVMIYAKAARSIYFGGITQHTKFIILKNSAL